VLLLSPHLDDSVFNCWSLLEAPGEVRVVNVFAGVPPTGTLSRWDQVCGADDSATQMRRRITEDAEALACVGRAATNLSFLDQMYLRCAALPPYTEIDAAIMSLVSRTSAVYAPVGVEHREHRFVRGYAATIARNGVPVHLYAEIPYATRLGWPPWVTGQPPEPNVNVDVLWRANPFIPDRSEARVVALGEKSAAAKLAAMRAYRSQLPALDAGPLRAVSNPAVHGFEVFWDLRT
jgi:hypothetical protein